MQRELDLHVEQLTREYIAAGINEAEARRTARRDFGSIEIAREECCDMRRVNRIDDLPLFAGFAWLALLLATMGLYGLVSCAVSQRKGEIGIRMALGATGSDVSRMMLFQGLKLAIAGIVLGLIAAAFACRILKSLLFGIAPVDWLTFSLVPLLLSAVAALACYVPAMRATRMDPTSALRAE